MKQEAALQRTFDGLTGETRLEGPVECLGLSFDSEESRRAYFLERLREKLGDPAFRATEGFPLGADEDILRLSDPPYFTVCPNPFFAEFVQCSGIRDGSDESYSREPFAADVSEGKNDSIYTAHSYHTKVPHKAIMRYILHYTNPDDVVLDGFSGTGMTGVAAQLCGDRAFVESMGYQTSEQGLIKDGDGTEISRLGARRAVLNDLSPAAGFIAYNYNLPFDPVVLERELIDVVSDIRQEIGWIYATLHKPRVDQISQACRLLDAFPGEITADSGLPIGQVNYVVWSDVFLCSNCSNSLVFWDVAVDSKLGSVSEVFRCPHCNEELTKRGISHAFEAKYDATLGTSISQARRVPVLINYSVERKRFEKRPDTFDLALLAKIDEIDISSWFPYDRMPDGEESRRNDDIGITHVHHFYTKRALISFSRLLQRSSSFPMLCALLGGYTVGLKTARFLPLRWINKDTGPMKPHTAGTLYIPSLSGEQNWFNILSSRVSATVNCLRAIQRFPRTFAIGCSSSSKLELPDDSIDYVFVDPPFGGNLMYSELNFIYESWMKVLTNNTDEAIENKVQKKGLLDYQEIMTKCMAEFHRVLKPRRWITVEFHNSQNKVWSAIQESIQSAGFVVADVRTLDKKQGTFKQVTSRGTVKQDLVISAYKPDEAVESKLDLIGGSEIGVWDFLHMHLQQLPCLVEIQGEIQIIAERLNYLLFDRMIAFHVQRGFVVPISASGFYAGLEQRFIERDGMYFLPEQVTKYDRARLRASRIEQLQLFVRDEESAILWLRQTLLKKPHTFQELQPQFMRIMRELASWQKYEKPLELSDLLEANFLCYDGKDDVPSQIHGYLSSNFHELRGLEKVDLLLRARARDRWYVPDSSKAGDLEKLREKALLKEFEVYRVSSARKLKEFRLEAVRAGFKRAWQNRDYATIMAVAAKIPTDVLQEDQKLIMWYDQALTRSGVEG